MPPTTTPNSNPQSSPQSRPSSTRNIVIAAVLILGAIGWLTITGVQDNKSYYVTISELNAMGSKAYTRHLRVAGNVAPGSIHRSGTTATFQLLEQGKVLQVSYQGTEPPPDTFKDEAQALAVGTYGKDGVFRATQLQAKCASKYAPAAPGANPSATPPGSPMTSTTEPTTTTATAAADPHLR